MPSMSAGAWMGSLAQTDHNQVIVSCTLEKWERARGYVLSMQETIAQGSTFHHKTLEQQRGFFVYVARTYPSLVPYLKGIHLTLDSWRLGHDSEGWKEARQVISHLGEACPADSPQTPEFFPPVPRLASDIEGLLTLLAADTPPLRVVRAKEVVTAYYGFGDASGAGFGDTLLTPNGIVYQGGLWGDDLHAQSSNYRELFNLTEAMEAHIADLHFPHLQHLVETFEETARSGLWMSAEVFLFTDNAVAEWAYYKGTSSNKALFELVLRLRKLEISSSIHLHLIHVSGLRMQAQGTDHLSRGILHLGVFRGAKMSDFIPLHLSALDQSQGIIPWCTSWCPSGHTLATLSPSDWYYKGHGLVGGRRNLDGVWQPSDIGDSPVCFLWTPPPAAAGAAVEQLAFSRLKRPQLLHIFVCPHLMTHIWRKRLFKTVDFTFALPAGHRANLWPAPMFKPLIVGVCLPFLPSHPWSRRATSSVLAVAGQLSGLRTAPQRDERAVLWQLWLSPGGREVCLRVWCGDCYTSHPLDKFHVNTPVDEAGYEWLVKDSDAQRFRVGHNGDHLITPFQCDWCLFRLLTG